MCGKDKGHKSERSTESSALDGNAESHIISQCHYLLEDRKEEDGLHRVKYA